MKNVVFGKVFPCLKGLLRLKGLARVEVIVVEQLNPKGKFKEDFVFCLDFLLLHADHPTVDDRIQLEGLLEVVEHVLLGALAEMGTEYRKKKRNISQVKIQYERAQSLAPSEGFGAERLACRLDFRRQTGRARGERSQTWTAWEHWAPHLHLHLLPEILAGDCRSERWSAAVETVSCGHQRVTIPEAVLQAWSSATPDSSQLPHH